MDIYHEAAQLRDQYMTDTKHDVWEAYGRMSMTLALLKRKLNELQPPTEETTDD